MTAFLYLQKFDKGLPVGMPFDAMLETLGRVGPVGRGSGDTEITLPADAIAAGCTVVGDSTSGVLCVGFERPAFDAALRMLVWDCMTRFGCAVFDDTLATVCTLHDGLADLPPALAAAAVTGARELGSAQQLWPDLLEEDIARSARPVLRTTNANVNGPHLQFFDMAEFDNNALYIEIGLRPEACNAGTLRILRNLELRVDAALSINPEYAVLYRYAEQETPLLVMESARLGSLNNRATIISPGVEEREHRPGFIANRELFAHAAQAAIRATERAHTEFGCNLDGGPGSIASLSELLDQLHYRYCQQRATHTSAEPFIQSDAIEWATVAGGFLGTVIRQQIGAQWGFVERGYRRLPVVRLHSGRVCNPHLLVLDHIINGPRSRVDEVFNRLQRDDASACPRDEDLVRDIPGFCQILLGASEFNSGGGLPLSSQIPRNKLDFSVASLRHLDVYLAQVVRKSGAFSDQTLSNLMLAAGAYLGETIRSNAAHPGDWQWLTYDDLARAHPEFCQQRTRQVGHLAILESATQMTYPLAHISAVLHGANVLSTHALALELFGRTPAAAAVVKKPAHAVHDPVDNHDAGPFEHAADAAVSALARVPQILTCLILVYAAKFSITAFNQLGGALSLSRSLPYIGWIASPCLFLGWISLTGERHSGRDWAVFFASVMLTYFAVGMVGIHLTNTSDMTDAGLFIWVPLVQLGWSVAWLYVLNRRIGSGQ